MTQFTKLTTTRLTIAMALVIGMGVAQAEVPVVQAPDVIELEFGQPFIVSRGSRSSFALPQIELP